MCDSTIPDNMKISVITPLFKNGKPADINNNYGFRGSTNRLIENYLQAGPAQGGGQTGQMPGAQHFGGPINYLRNIFLLFIKKKIFINSICIHSIFLYTINFN